MVACLRAAGSRPYEGSGKRAVEGAGPYDAEIPDIAVGATLAVARWLRRVPPYIVAVGDAALGVPFSRTRKQPKTGGDEPCPHAMDGLGYETTYRLTAVHL